MTLHNTMSREARAQMLLANREHSSRRVTRLPSGEQIGVVLFASVTRPGVVYLTRCDGAPGACTCPAAQRTRSGQCCHQLAVAREAQMARDTATRSRVTLDDLYDNHLVDAF